ncbi:MAG: hypothetical protein JWR16_495 [Nevskia sp.]|nr:hypothetical protein [Nevskia sp.]
MKQAKLIGLVLAAGAFIGSASADPFALKPGQYETRVEATDGSHKPVVDTDCITPEDAKDIVAYFKQQGSEESCKLTDSKLEGKHFTGVSSCKGGGDKPFATLDVKSDLKFTDIGYSGTLLENGTGTDSKPFTKKLKISAKRIGECKAS